jgi:predicted ATPase
MSDEISVIRTPDQRLRVFVSSTLKELAEERGAARQAITNLRLIPVMFELGARPHPSRDLYRAYIEQSQIFIGIYWQQYGWIASDMDISGIEDEFLLAEKLPKLIYLKSPAPQIEPGLKTMIRGIQKDSTVSYKRFSRSEELGELIENDLAVLITEHFYALDIATKKLEQRADDEAVQKPMDVIEHNLPVQATPFIGRGQEVSEVCELLDRDEVRLLTLTGPGGTGKTRLGLEVAHRLLNKFESGVFFVPLADLSDPDLMISKTAQQLELREGGSQPLLESLKTYLQNKEILLLLDNFEHLIPAVDMVAELLTATSWMKVLATSRTILNLRGEYEYPVPPLKLPDREQIITVGSVSQSEAFQLFAARAEAASPHFEINDNNVKEVAEICHQLDGLPLAIELTAARVKLLPPQAILERLSSRLQLLTGGARDLPERQQTLRNTLDWSYSLLDPGVQVLFSRLGVFVGGFTLEAAEAICEGVKYRDGDSRCDIDVLDGLEALVNNSLLRVEENAKGQTRFRMLETIREYALECLTGRGETEALRDQHMLYFFNKLSELVLSSGMQTSVAGYWLDWVEIEHDNLRASMAWCIENPKYHDLGPLLLASLIWFWFRRGFLSEGREWSRRMSELPVAQDRTQEQVLTLISNGALAMWQGDLKIALSTIDEAVVLARWLELPYHLAIAALFKGTTLVNMGEDKAAQPLLEEAEALFEELNMPWYVATTKVHLGNAALGMGNTSVAITYLKSAEILSWEINEKWLISFVMNNFGEVSRVKGEYDKAQSYYEQSEALLREMGDKGELARLVHNLGSVAQHKGNLEQAREQYYESLSMFSKLGNQRGIAECLASLAGLWAEEGDLEASVRLIGAASALLNQTGGSWWPADRVEYERNINIIKGGLEEKVFEMAWNEGQEMTLEEVIGLAGEAG